MASKSSDHRPNMVEQGIDSAAYARDVMRDAAE